MRRVCTLLTAGILAVGFVNVAATTAGAATTAPAPTVASSPLPVSAACPTPAPTRVDRHFLGISRPQRIGVGPSSCPSAAPGSSIANNAEPPYLSGATPPLIGPPTDPNHYGPVLGTDPNGGQVTVTPIYWAPAGYSFTQSYQNVVNGYLNNVATDSGKPTNVFSVATQYTDAAGNPIRYHLSEDSAIVDATAPAGGGCTPDSGAIYADYTPYTSCIDDAQLQGEINTVLATHGLVSDQTHMYLVFLPKGVESCFTSANGAAGGDCSTNPSSATTGKGFCGYHSATTSNSGVYSDLAFPIYSSPTNFGCGPQVPGGAGSAISER